MCYLQINTLLHTTKMIVLPSFFETFKADIQVLQVFIKSVSIYIYPLWNKHDSLVL